MEGFKKDKIEEKNWETQSIINAIENAESIIEVNLINERISTTLRALNARTFKGGNKEKKQIMEDLFYAGGVAEAKVDEFSGLTSVANYAINNSWIAKNSPILGAAKSNKLIIN